MANKVKVWFDAEADFLEVRFSDLAGYEKATSNDALMERIDEQGNVIGFSILGVSRFKKDKPLIADFSVDYNFRLSVFGHGITHDKILHSFRSCLAYTILDISICFSRKKQLKPPLLRSLFVALLPERRSVSILSS